MVSAIRAERVSVTLGKANVLRNIDLDVPAGRLIGLIGPNGAGKSTLLRALAGQQEFSGRIELAGADLRSVSPASRARQLAFLPQTRQIAWSISVRRVVALGRMPWRGQTGNDAGRDQLICEEALAATDTHVLAERSATQLSGGEQARVLLARAFAQDTPLLLADEPAAGLDPAHQISMMLALQKLARRGRAVLVSLHDLGMAARFCDQIAVLDQGALVEFGQPREVITKPMLASVFGIEARIEHEDGAMSVTPTGLSTR